MKKLFALSFFLFSFCFCIKAQPLYLHWTKFFGGTMSETPRDAVATSDGGIVFTGNTSSFDGDIPYSQPDTNNGLRYNLMVGKIDSNKQLEWMKVYGGQREDYGYRVIQTADGGYAVLGQTFSSDGDVTWNRGTDDIWLLRLDASGNLLWQKTYGSTFSDQAISLAETSDGSFIILGRANGADHDVPFHYGTSQFEYDFLVLKVTASGNMIWSKTIGGYGNEGQTGSIFEANGGYYLACFSNSRDNDCVDTSWCPGVSTFHDYYLFFLDTSGNIQWAKSYGGTDADAVRNALWDDRDSTVILVGITSSTDYMVSQSYSGVTSAWLIKTDNNGNLLWETTLGDTVQDNVNADVMPVDEGYFVGGTFEDVLQMHYGFTDIFTNSVDSAGVVISYKIIGGNGGDACAAVVPLVSTYAVIGRSSTFLFAEGVNENSNHTQNNQSDVTLSSVNGYPLKVDNSSSNAKLGVYPNPAKDMVKVVLPAKTTGTLLVKDASGREIHKLVVENKKELDLTTAAWARGLYSLTWQASNGERGSAKLVIK